MGNGEQDNQAQVVPAKVKFFVEEIREGKRSGLKIARVSRILFEDLAQADDIAAVWQKLDDRLRKDVIRRIDFELMPHCRC